MNGAWARAGSTLFIWILFPITGLLSNNISSESFWGMNLVAMTLLAVNPPSLYLLKKVRTRKVYEILSLFINLIDVTCYTILIYYAGGIRANHFLLTYAGVITYVGVSAPRRITITVAIFSILQYNALIILEHFEFLPHQNLHISYGYQFMDATVIGLSSSALIAVVAYMATTTGSALRRNRNNLRMRNIEFDRINKIARIANQSLDMEIIMNSVCQELNMQFPIRYAAIGLLSESREELRMVAYHSDDPNLPDLKGTVLNWTGNERFWTALEALEPINIRDADTNPITSKLHQHFKSAGIKSMLYTPVANRGTITGVIGMPSTSPDYIFSESDMRLVQTISNQISATISNVKVFAKTESALGDAERDLELGKQIQAGFLTETPPKVEGWEIATAYFPARQVAGDFYDAFPVGTDGAFAFLVGDVCDKGVGAALFMAVFRSLIRSFALARQPGSDLGKYMLSIITSVNTYISQTHDRENMFATLFMGLIDPKTNKMYYVNAGHDIPFLMNQEGGLACALQPTGPALGLMADMLFEYEIVDINQGETLFIYTDGVIDARNTVGEPFSEKTLLGSLESPFPSALSMVTQVELNIRQHIQKTPQFDDIAMLCVRRGIGSEILKHQIKTNSSLENLPNLRHFIEQASESLGISEEVMFNFKLALDEIATNINTHGYDTEDGGPISLSYMLTDGQVSLVIEDEGLAFNSSLEATVDVDAEIDERNIGGLGLFMVQEMMDKVEYERIENKINRTTLIKSNTIGAKDGN